MRFVENSVRAFLFTCLLGFGTPSHAEPESTAPRRAEPESASPTELLYRLAWDYRALLTRTETYGVLAVGLGAAWGAHHFDTTIATGSFNSELDEGTKLDAFFEAGSVLGGPLQVGALFATYGLGRLLARPELTGLGEKLVRASIVTHSITLAIKLSVARERPDRSNRRSFPSGHASGSFATATVLHARYGWKIGAPAGAVAGYIAVSRLNEGRHYLSDIVFGTALGLVAGRTVTREPEERSWALGTRPIPAGFGIQLTWTGTRKSH